MMTKAPLFLSIMIIALSNVQAFQGMTTGTGKIMPSPFSSSQKTIHDSIPTTGFAPESPHHVTPNHKLPMTKAAQVFFGAVLSAALVLLPPTEALASSPVITTPAATTASETAAQISLERLPPTSINVQIKDLPVVGKLLSGTYSKVPDNVDIAKPSIVIKSPSDKAKAIQNLVKNGHLEFDVSGSLINTHLDIDVAAEKPKVMNVRIASDIIPKLPFKNLASYSTEPGSPTGGKESAWNMVTNMGSGETYYYNEKTGVTQYERPAKF